MWAHKLSLTSSVSSLPCWPCFHWLDIVNHRLQSNPYQILNRKSLLAMKTETIFSSQLLQNPPPPLRFASFQDIGLSPICDLNRIYARIDVLIDKKNLYCFEINLRIVLCDLCFKPVTIFWSDILRENTNIK